MYMFRKQGTFNSPLVVVVTWSLNFFSIACLAQNLHGGRGVESLTNLKGTPVLIQLQDVCVG